MSAPPPEVRAARGTDQHDGGGALSDQWTLWLDRGVRVGDASSSSTSSSSSEGTAEQLATVGTARDFWRLWGSLAPLMGPLSRHGRFASDSELRAAPRPRAARGQGEPLTRCNICVFRKGIRPSWDDPANRQGGAWTLKVPRSVSDELANNVLAQVINEQVPLPPRAGAEPPVCGVFVRVRYAVVALDVWARYAEPEEAISAVSDHFNRVIGALVTPMPVLIPPVVFYPHDSPSKPCTVLMASHASLLSPSVGDLRSYAADRDRRPLSASTGAAPAPAPASAPVTPRSQPSSPLSAQHYSRLGTTHSLRQTPSPLTAETRTQQQHNQQQRAKRSGSSGSSTLVVCQSPKEPAPRPATAGGPATATATAVRASVAAAAAPNDQHIRSASVGEELPASQAEKRKQQQASSGQMASLLLQQRMRQSAGLQQAIPLLLRQGYAVPFAAYKDLVQAQALAETEVGSSEAQACEQHLRSRSRSYTRHSPTLDALPADVMGHRRAFSLDRTALDEAYAHYTQAKQEAFLRDMGQAPAHSGQQQQQQHPLAVSTTLPAVPAAQEWRRPMGQVPIPGVGVPRLSPLSVELCGVSGTAGKTAATISSSTQKRKTTPASSSSTPTTAKTTEKKAVGSKTRAKGAVAPRRFTRHKAAVLVLLAMQLWCLVFVVLDIAYTGSSPPSRHASRST